MKKLLSMLLVKLANVLHASATWCLDRAVGLQPCPISRPYGGCLDCGGLTFATREDWNAHLRERHAS